MNAQPVAIAKIWRKSALLFGECPSGWARLGYRCARPAGLRVQNSR